MHSSRYFSVNNIQTEIMIHHATTSRRRGHHTRRIFARCPYYMPRKIWPYKSIRALNPRAGDSKKRLQQNISRRRYSQSTRRIRSPRTAFNNEPRRRKQSHMSLSVIKIICTRTRHAPYTEAQDTTGEAGNRDKPTQGIEAPV